jgi:hypothetical protein
LPFLRFSRDKRGVENFYLVQPTTNRRGKVRPRVLYWFRSPPDVKVGREPFDADARRALEAQNPGIEFDWRGIAETPIPSADADKWRERRRADRAAKHAAAEEDAKVAAADEEPADSPHVNADTADVPSPHDSSDPEPAVAVAAAPGIVQSGQPSARNPDSDRRRRRRRRSGGRRDNAAASDATPPVPPTDSSGD